MRFVPVLAALAFLAVGGSALAAVSVSVDPYFEADVIPGNTVSKEIRVGNPGPDPVTITVEMADYSQDEKGNPRTGKPGSSAFGAGSWLEVDSKPFRLEPGGVRYVPVRVRVPDSALTGTYGAVVFFTGHSGEKLQGTGAEVIGKAGSLVLMRVRGAAPARESGAVTGLRMPKLSLSYPIPVEIRFRNTGNVHSRVSGVLSLEPMTGGEPVTAKLGERRVLPGSEVGIGSLIERGPVLALWRVRAWAVNESGLRLGQPWEGGTVAFVAWEIPAGILLSMLGGAFLATVLRRRPRELPRTGSA